MSKEYFTDNLSKETITKMIDKTFKYKNNKKIKPNLFKLIPAVAMIVLVIGIINILPFLINVETAPDNFAFITNENYETTIYYRNFEKYRAGLTGDSSFKWEPMETLNSSKNTDAETVKSYYVDQIIEDVIEDLMIKYNYTREMATNIIYSGGLNIYGCMDADIQSVMEWGFTHDDYFPEQSEGEVQYQAAMVVIDPYSGDLLGIIGGRGEKIQRGLNRASMIKRQPGSAINPISVYAPALDRGIINYETLLDDSPSMTINGNPWPQNYPAGNEGMISLSRAIAVSKNTTAVRVLEELTPEYSFKFCYDKLNMKSLVEERATPNGAVLTDINLAGLALGGLTNGVSVYELTGAYTMLANKGIYSKPRSYIKVTDHDGNVILDNQPEKRAVISEETADIMTKLLQGVVENGTAKGLPMANLIEVAGKTGTTNDDYDRWFIGYTPYYLCGCWFGYDTPKYLGTGVGDKNPPAQLFNYVMNTIHEPVYDNPKTFDAPQTITK